MRGCILCCAIVVACSNGASRSASGPGIPPAKLPIYGTLPELRLSDQDGHAFSNESLKDRVWIAAFVFTSCPMECPLLSDRMSYVQKLLSSHAPAIRMLSISIDPQNDTPAVLAKYGQRYHRDPRRWTFVTGPYEAALDDVAKGYRQAVATEHRVVKQGDFKALHGQNLVLIDGTGLIRGYYGKDDSEISRLLHDADALATAGASR